MRRSSFPPLAVLPLLLLLSNVSSAPVDLARERDLVGWLGETYDLNATSASAGKEQPTGGMLVLSWEPRIFLYQGFLTEAESEELIAMASPQQSKVLRPGEGDVVRRVEERIARWSMTSAKQGEGMEVHRHDQAEKHEPRHDDEPGKDADGVRLCTALMYLSDVEEGGEAVFSKLPVPKGQSKAAGYSDCAMKGLAHKPKKGDALLVWSIRTDGTVDSSSLRSSCPMTKGHMWTATKRVYVAKRSS